MLFQMQSNVLFKLFRLLTTWAGLNLVIICTNSWDCYKWYRTWRAEHPEFEKIVFHGLRHSSATYQLIESGGNTKAVQGNTGHATTGILMDTYAHTQDKPRLELAEKLEADFYSQDIGSPKSGSVPVKENLPDSIQITPEGMLKVVRQMNPEQRREFTRLLFA